MCSRNMRTAFSIFSRSPNDRHGAARKGAALPSISQHRSRQNVLDDLATNAGESIIEALVEVRQPRMIQAHQVQNRGMKVRDMTALLHRIEAEFVGGADRLAAFDA